MADPTSIIKFHAGRSGAHRYFYIGEDGCSKRAARVSMSTMSKIKGALDHRQEIELPVTNLAEFLATYLPVPFLVQLKHAGISMVEAWNYMSGKAFPASVSTSPRSKREVAKQRQHAVKLAHILAAVDGGKKSPRDLVTTLMSLIKGHLPQALEILQEMAATNGFRNKGGYVLVAPPNRNARKAPTKAA